MKMVVIMILWLLPCLASGQEKSTLPFNSASNWEQAITEAKAAGKCIFVDAYATWCISCKKMEEDVLTDSAVVKNEALNAENLALATAESRDDIGFCEKIILGMKRDEKIWEEVK